MRIDYFLQSKEKTKRKQQQQQNFSLFLCDLPCVILAQKYISLLCSHFFLYCETLTQAIEMFKTKVNYLLIWHRKEKTTEMFTILANFMRCKCCPSMTDSSGTTGTFYLMNKEAGNDYGSLAWTSSWHFQKIYLTTVAGNP